MRNHFIYHPIYVEWTLLPLSLDRSISNFRSVSFVLILPFIREIPVFNANGLDPDQTPRSAGFWSGSKLFALNSGILRCQI